MKTFFLKKLGILFMIVFVLSIVFSLKTFAIEDNSDSVAQKYGITFPVETLGNCSSLNECKTYCNDPVNQTQCIEFAKQKGFYKEKANAVKRAISIAAKQELGCDSEKACKEFCSEQANWQSCGKFAKDHSLGGGQVEDPSKKEILGKAKESLGCDSLDTCKGFCKIEENQQKCDEFAKLTGLRGGVEKTGPGGCSSLDSCKVFCSDPANFQLCQGFVKATGGEFKGPGGCDSEDSCKVYCMANGSECKSLFKEPEKPSYTKAEQYCNNTPNCRWSDNRCECKSSYSGPQGAPAYQNADERARFCREFPDRCQNGSIAPLPSSSTTPYPTPSLIPYSTVSPSITPKPSSTPQATSTTSTSPDDSFCNGGDSNYFSKGSCTDVAGTHTDYCDGSTVRSWYCTGTWNGTSWSNRHCEAGGYVCSSAGYSCSDGACVGGSTPTATPAPTTVAPTPAPTAGNTGTGSSVKGISVVKSLLDRIMDRFR